MHNHRGTRVHPIFKLLLTAWLALLALQAGADPASNPAEFDRLYNQATQSGLAFSSIDEAAALTERLRQHLPADDLHRQARLDQVVCQWQFDADYETGRDYAAQRLAIYQARQLAWGEAAMRLCRASFASVQDEIEIIRDDLIQSVTLARETDDVLLQAEALRARGEMHSYLGDYMASLEDVLEAHRILSAAGAESQAERLLFELGSTYRRLGEFEQALRYLKAARDAAQRSREQGREVLVLVQLGFTYYELSESEQALAVFEEALTQAPDSGAGRGHVLVGKAMALILLERYAPGLEVLDQAELVYAEVGSQFNRTMIKLQRAMALAGLARHEQALELFAEVEPLLKKSQRTRYLALLYPARANSLEAVGHLRQALADWRQLEAVRVELEQRAQRDRADVLRLQFDVSRREVENERLRLQAEMQEQRVKALTRTRAWQTVSLILAAVLGLILLAALGFLARRARRLQIMAMTDELTGVANRRRTEFYLRQELQRARQRGHDLTVIALDIDHFKRVNDTWGHPAGDRVLCRVAQACVDSLLRPNDLAGRTGGEEFLIVLPGTDSKAGLIVAERLRRAIEDTDMSDIIAQPGVTVSLGVASLRAGEPVRDLMARADRMLYRAKQRGRNRSEQDAAHDDAGAGFPG